MFADVECFCDPNSEVVIDLSVCECVIGEEFSGELCLVVLLYVVFYGTGVACCFVKGEAS